MTLIIIYNDAKSDLVDATLKFCVIEEPALRVVSARDRVGNRFEIRRAKLFVQILLQKERKIVRL
jgi:hypothetical protein